MSYIFWTRKKLKKLTFWTYKIDICTDFFKFKKTTFWTWKILERLFELVKMISQLLCLLSLKFWHFWTNFLSLEKLTFCTVSPNLRKIDILVWHFKVEKSTFWTIFLNLEKLDLLDYFFEIEKVFLCLCMLAYTSRFSFFNNFTQELKLYHLSGKLSSSYKSAIRF